MKNNIITITEEHDGQRLDRWFKKTYPHIAYGQAQKLIRTGQIRVNGKRAKGETLLSVGEELRLPPSLAQGGHTLYTNPKASVSDADKKFIQGIIAYEDKNIVALNKPHGLAVQGGSKTSRHIDGMLAGLQKDSQAPKPKLLHRIDKDTSGLLLCGKTNAYTRYVMQCFKHKTLQKIYLAVCSPAPKAQNGIINAPLIKQKVGYGASTQERVVVDEEEGQRAITHFEVLDRIGKDAALVCFSPITGRTHQIRVHAAYMGFPIVGDPKYNTPEYIEQHLTREEVEDTIESVRNLCRYKGLHLHAAAAHIPANPDFGGLTLFAPLSHEMETSLNLLGLERPSKEQIIDFTNP